MTNTDTLRTIRPDDPPPTTTDDRTREPAKPRLELSATQVIGGAAAAATAAALGAKLGVAGTIVGAAVISLISAVAGSLYTASLRRTRDGMKAAVGAVNVVRVRRVDGSDVTLTTSRTSDSTSTTTDSATTHSATTPDDLGEAAPGSGAAGDEPTDARSWRVRPRTVLLGAAATFLLTAIGVTGWELATGNALDGTPGTTIQQVGNDRGAGSTAPASDAPTTRPTDLPSSSAPANKEPSGQPSTDPAYPSSQPSTPSAPSSAPATPSSGATPSAQPSPEAQPSAAPAVPTR